MSRPPLVVLRPAPGDAATMRLAEAEGWRAVTAPLFAIEPTEWDAPDPAQFDALVLTSANALRHGGERTLAYRGLPVFAVGGATAEAARRAGFTVAGTGRGGAEALHAAARAAGHRRMLRLAGADHVPLPADVVTRIVYAARPRPLDPGVAMLLADTPAIVALHSAAAARHFDAEAARLALPRARHAIAALAPAVAAAAGGGWARVAAADRPADPALLSLAARLARHDAGWQSLS